MQEPDYECVQYLMNHCYIKNHPTFTFLQDFHFSIPLNQFILYCVGIHNGIRQVNCLRILEKKPSDKITTIKIHWYNPSPPLSVLLHQKVEEWDYKEFWVNSTISLRKFFFCYEDKFNFFRSTFIYYPEIQQYFRLCNLFNHLHLPEINPLNDIVYILPNKSFEYKKIARHSPKKYEERRKREIQKGLHRFIKKHNVDKFLETQYPDLFYVIKQFE